MLGLRHVQQRCPQSFLDVLSSTPVGLRGPHNSPSKGGLPIRREVPVKLLPPLFCCANHVGVEIRKVQVSRKRSASNTTLSEVHDGPAQDALNTSLVFGWDCRGLTHDGCEGIACERLELVVS